MGANSHDHGVKLKPDSVLRFRYICPGPPNLPKMNSPPANISGVNTTDNLYDDYNGTLADAAMTCHNR